MRRQQERCGRQHWRTAATGGTDAWRRRANARPHTMVVVLVMVITMLIAVFIVMAMVIMLGSRPATIPYCTAATGPAASVRRSSSL